MALTFENGNSILRTPAEFTTDGYEPGICALSIAIELSIKYRLFLKTRERDYPTPGAAYRLVCEGDNLSKGYSEDLFHPDWILQALSESSGIVSRVCQRRNVSSEHLVRLLRNGAAAIYSRGRWEHLVGLRSRRSRSSRKPLGT